jgi:hypothetical protein
MAVIRASEPHAFHWRAQSIKAAKDGDKNGPASAEPFPYAAFFKFRVWRVTLAYELA